MKLPAKISRSFWLVLTGGLLLFAPLELDAQIFTKLTNDPSANDGGSSHALSWGDYNNDGLLDLIVSHHAGQDNLLCRNNGNGTFTKITNGIVVHDGGDSYGTIWGDYDNDGWLDLFVANVGTNWLYRNNGDSTFSRVTNGNTISGQFMNSTACAWGDYDNDGNLDLFVANYHDQHNFLYHNNGDGSFTRITNGIVVNDTPGASGCGWGDYDNDGYPDLFVSNPFSTNGLNLLYHNNGDGTFTKITNGPVVTEAANSYGCVWADYDGDGWLDLFVANNGQKNFLYHNNGDGTFSKVTTGSIVNDVAGFYNGCWADYDNDGWLDLFVANFTGNNFLYHNNGDGSFTKILTDVVVTDGGRSAGCGWGDIDNDGAMDLYVTNHGGNNYLYRNNGNTNAWLVVRCRGTLSNRAGIGAKVTIKAKIKNALRSQCRQVSNGDSVSGGSLDAHFGLGDAASIDSIRIQWPSGVIQDLANVPTRQILTVTEPALHLSATRTTDADFKLIVISRRNTIVQIESSTNGFFWASWGLVTNSFGQVEVKDNLSFEQRFYRAFHP
jgi:hypothetical protein